MPEPTLAQRIRAKYPGVYDDIADDVLEAKVIAKYPGVYDDLPRTTARTPAAPAAAPEEPGLMDAVMRPPSSYGEILTDPYRPGNQIAMVKGGVKGAVNTAAGLGDAVDYAARAVAQGTWNPERDASAFDTVRQMTGPENAGESAGRGVEQMAEFLFVPGPGKVSGASRLATAGKTAWQLAKAGGGSAALTAAQGGSPTAAAVSGVTSVVPVGGVLAAVGRKAKELAPELVRAAVKPTVAALKRTRGLPDDLLEDRAQRLVRFILDNDLATPDAARKMMTEANHATERALATKNAPTNAAERALRYLEELKRAAAKQGRPQESVAAIEQAARELLEGPMGQDVTKVVGVDDAGNAITEVVREPRTDIMADEALELARGGNKFSVGGNQYGMRGDKALTASTEADKAIIRAQRDAAKDAIPELVQSQGKYGQAKEARGVLDRMQQRQKNRETFSLPAQVLAAGGHPILAFASNWLRNNPMKSGMAAKRLAEAIEKGRPQEAAFYLLKLGASIPSAISRPVPARAGIAGPVG